MSNTTTPSGQPTEVDVTTLHMLNTPQVAEYIAMKESWVRDNWRSQGIPFLRLGGRLVCQRAELDTWLSKQRAA